MFVVDFDIAEPDREAFGVEQVGCVLYLEVEVGFGAVAGVSTRGQLLALCDGVSDGDRETAGDEMGVEAVLAGAVFDNHIVA